VRNTVQVDLFWRKRFLINYRRTGQPILKCGYDSWRGGCNGSNGWNSSRFYEGELEISSLSELHIITSKEILGTASLDVYLPSIRIWA
jgi:hypothetical protein